MTGAKPLQVQRTCEPSTPPGYRTALNAPNLARIAALTDRVHRQKRTMMRVDEKDDSSSFDGAGSHKNMRDAARKSE